MKKIYAMLLFLLFFICSCTSQSTNEITSKPITTFETTSSAIISTEVVTITEEISHSDHSMILESISIDQSTLQDKYQLDDFNVEEIDLILNFSQDLQGYMSLDESMLVESISNIIEPGTYTFNVEYLNQETSFTVEVIDNIDIKSISIDMNSYNPYALVSTFDISQIMLDITLENDDTKQVPLSFEMINELDTNKLFVEGYHHIDVEYQGFETEFTIAMIKESPEENPLYNLDTEAAMFYEVFDLLIENHYKEPSIGMLFEGATKGMIDVLDDRFTLLFNQEEYSKFYGSLNENYVGTGIYLGIRDDFVIVSRVIKDSPADLAGIQVDDIIHSINGDIVTTDNINSLYQLMNSGPDFNINIIVKRLGEDELISYTLQTVEIELESLSYEVLEDNNQKIGLITISNFSSQTDERFIEALDHLESQNIDSLMIDLRNNGGGFLDTVVNMLQVLLVNDSIPILTMDYPNQMYTYYGEASEKKPYDIITLVNGNTASAAEVFAAAMQEHGNYTIIGQTTYGKGIAQTTRSLEANSDVYLHISNAKWFTPLGNWIHFQGGSGGVQPDIEVQTTELENAMKIYLYHQDILLYDSVSNDNIVLQIILNGMGYAVRTDGYYDIFTRDAVSDLQETHDLEVTGNVDDQTAILINQWLREYQDTYDNQLMEAIDFFSDK